MRGYLKIGLPTSEQLAIKFASEDSFGLACRRNRITVLDVDAPDERLLADAMSELGPSPFIVRSGSGNFQAWYRHNGERRKIRPDHRPIYILGDGFVVAPPSIGPNGTYSIVSGSLDDLAALPTMRRVKKTPQRPQAPPAERVEAGRRNDALWRVCMAQARQCSNINELMESAMRQNEQLFYEPLPDGEVLRIVGSAWAKEQSGENMFGRGSRVVIPHDQIDALLRSNPDAFILLTILRRHHWGRDFVCANAMADSMPRGGWPRQRFAGARRALEQMGEIEQLRPASRQSGPALYRFKGVSI